MTERPKSDRHLSDEQLEQLLDTLDVEKAPASLSERLMAIPETEKAPSAAPGRRRWLAPWLLAPAFAAVPLVLFIVLMMQPPVPSDDEIRQARQDLALAFRYIEGVGEHTGTQIQQILGEGLHKSVKEPLSRHLPYTEQSNKETTS